jgi:hypothetical protein
MTLEAIRTFAAFIVLPLYLPNLAKETTALIPLRAELISTSGSP